MNQSRFKGYLLLGAEVVDAWRVYPRLFLTWYACIVMKLVLWYVGLTAPSEYQTGMIAGVVGLCVPMLNWYMKNGRTWTNGADSNLDNPS